MLVRLLYASRAVGGITPKMLDGILEQSHANNPTHGVTGILCSYTQGGVFLQALEGGRAAVNALYGNIVRDPRHENVTLLEYAEIDERRFAAWRMGSIAVDKVNRSSILRYSASTTLDPFAMSTVSALAFLEELASGAAIVDRDKP